MSAPTARPADSRIAGRAQSAADALTRVSHVVMMRIFLAAVFITVFFENLAFNRYTEGGYARLIDRYAGRNDAPAFWNDGIMGFFSDNAVVFSKLQAVTELTFGLLLVLGVATAVVAFAAAGFLASLWVSELGLFWIWELLGLVVIALAVGFATLPDLLRGSMRERVLGPPSSTKLSLGSRLGMALGGGVGLALIVDAAQTGGADNGAVAARAGLVFGVALVALALLDELRRRGDTR